MSATVSVVAANRLVPAAQASVASIDKCYLPLAEMELPNDERTNVAMALLYASIEQARSASFLVAHDAEQSLFGSLILLRSQTDQLMRASFFAGPATDEELAFYLANDKLPPRNGNLLGPNSLSKINEEHFGWLPKGRVPDTIANSWAALSGMTHGGRALLAFYSSADGIGPHPPTDEFIEVFTNSVAFTHLAVSVALTLARNPHAENLQAALHAWHEAGRQYFEEWAPKLPMPL